MDRFICFNYEEITFDDLINKELDTILMNDFGNILFRFNFDCLQDPINDIFDFQ
jgi:hypothetical protein